MTPETIKHILTFIYTCVGDGALITLAWACLHGREK